jgi:hypothetical protein
LDPPGALFKKALKDFARVVEQGEHPKPVHKPSGVDKKGNRFALYVRLNLWHHHLERAGEPLLILQIVGDDVLGLALTRTPPVSERSRRLPPWGEDHCP